MSNYINEDKKCIDIVSSIFTHINREYFSKQLYRERMAKSKNKEIKKFAKELKYLDDREIISRLFSTILYDNGIYVCPMGMLWFSPCSEELAKENAMKMKPLFDDYWQWQIEQR